VFSVLDQHFGSRAASMRALAQGDPEARAIVGRFAGGQSNSSFGGVSIGPPQTRADAGTFGGWAEDTVRGQGQKAANSYFAAGLRRVAGFLGNDEAASQLNEVRGTPAVAAFQSASEAVRSHFADLSNGGVRNQQMMVGVTAAASVLGGAQYKGALSSLRLLGEGLGIGALTGNGFKSGREFLTAVHDLVAQRDAEPKAVAAIESFGAKVADGHVTDRDVTEFIDTVKPALSRVHNQGIGIRSTFAAPAP
jgi:hypothetical protein